MPFSPYIFQTHHSGLLVENINKWKNLRLQQLHSRACESTSINETQITIDMHIGMKLILGGGGELRMKRAEWRSGTTKIC